MLTLGTTLPRAHTQSTVTTSMGLITAHVLTFFLEASLAKFYGEEATSAGEDKY